MNIDDKLAKAPNTQFVQSLRQYYASKGFLTAGQQNALDVVIEKDKSEMFVYKKQKVDKDPESYDDLIF